MAKEAEELEQQAKRISALREEKARQLGRSVPQPEVAEAVGVTLRAYQAWEAGDIDPKREHLKGLADFHGVTTDFIEYGVKSRSFGRPPDILAAFEPGDVEKRLERIETQVSELHGLLLGKTPDANVVAGIAARLLQAGGWLPDRADDPPGSSAADG